jgi:hypothetical protein
VIIPPRKILGALSLLINKEAKLKIKGVFLEKKCRVWWRKKKKNESLRFENRGYIETKGRRCEIRKEGKQKERKNQNPIKLKKRKEKDERERERVLSLKCRYC